MLIIRKEQIAALSETGRHRMILNIMAHVKEYFPEETEVVAEDELYERISRTIERAKPYGILAERDVYKFVDVSMIYGMEFDEAEETAWTKTYLTDPDIPGPRQRMDLLFDEVVHRLETEENNSAIAEAYYGNSPEWENNDEN